jgi:hypothetical protein
MFEVVSRFAANTYLPFRIATARPDRQQKISTDLFVASRRRHVRAIATAISTGGQSRTPISKNRVAPSLLPSLLLATKAAPNLERFAR